MNFLFSRKSWLYSKGMMLFILIITFVFLLFFIKEDRFVGRADAACYASLAKSILHGEGYKLNFVPNPEYDIKSNSVYFGYSLLQPAIIVLSFLASGANAFAAKLPNVVILLIFIWIIYITVGRIFSKAIGFLSATITLFCFLGYKFILYPWADILYFLLVYLFIYFFTKGIVNITEMSYRDFIFAGVASGIGILQKPSATSIIPFSFIIFLIFLFIGKKEIKLSLLIKKMLIFYFILGLLGSPYFIRDFMLTGNIISSQHYSFAIAKYRFSSQASSFGAAWPLKGAPSLENVIHSLGIKYVLKDSLSQIILGLRSLFIWCDIVPFFILFLFFGYLVGMPLKNTNKTQRCFFLVFAIFFSFSFLLYTAYGGYEARHLRIFIPFFTIFAMKFFLDVIKNILESNNSRINKYLKLGVIALLFFVYSAAMLNVSIKRIKEQAADVEMHSILSGLEWIKDNTAVDDLILTYDVCSLSFHADRKTVMIPDLKGDEVVKIAKKYNARYIYMDLLTQARRPDFFSFCEHHAERFQKVFSKDKVGIYLIR
jgi:4-amino-4-deoxy-L-arabinose transferase-like glycosyltransferase